MENLFKNIIKVFCILAFVTLLMFVGNVITIANQIETATNVYCAYAFYAVLFVLLLIFIVVPIIKILKMPSIMEFSEVDDDISVESLQIIATNLAKNYPDNDKTAAEAKKQFEEEIEGKGFSDKKGLKEIVNVEIKRRLDTIEEKIKQYGKRVFILTAISQSNRIDTIAVWVLNFRMIKDLIASAGFRPSIYQMFQIYWRVLVTGAFAFATSEVLDVIDDEYLSDISVEVGEKLGGSIFGKLFGVFSKSLVDGAVNGLFTLRLGYVTKKYLEVGFEQFNATEKINNQDVHIQRIKIYKESIKEAWKLKKEIMAA